MEPTWEFDETIVDNKDQFQNEFFNRFELRHAPKPLQLNDKISKNYLFPTFYGNVTCAQAIFLCPYENARRMMLHPKIEPVRMPKGRAIVAFSCYEYKNVLGIPPYNEIAMTIPVLVDPTVNIPVLPMLASGLFSGFGYYVFSMPVTSLENQIRGVKIWGLPKVVQPIDVEEKDGDCVTVGYEESGEEYFKLIVPTGGTPSKFDVSSNLYSRLGNQLLQSETNFKATFNMTKYGKMLFQSGLKPDREYLKIGNSPSGQMLKALKIDPHPFQFRFAKGMSSCFDLANSDFKSPIQFEK